MNCYETLRWNERINASQIMEKEIIHYRGFTVLVQNHTSSPVGSNVFINFHCKISIQRKGLILIIRIAEQTVLIEITSGNKVIEFITSSTHTQIVFL